MGAQSCVPLACCRISIHMWLLNTKGAPQNPTTTTACPAAGSSSFRKHSRTQWDWALCPLWCLQDTWGWLQPMGEGTASCMSADSSERTAQATWMSVKTSWSQTWLVCSPRLKQRTDLKGSEAVWPPNYGGNKAERDL